MFYISITLPEIIGKDILGNLADDVERIDIGISNETQHVRTVSSLESSTCGYWVVIMCLFFAIVVVALL